MPTITPQTAPLPHTKYDRGKQVNETDPTGKVKKLNTAKKKTTTPMDDHNYTNQTTYPHDMTDEWPQLHKPTP